MDNAEDEDVKKVITCFTLDTTGAEIVKKMSSITMQPLKKAAVYLDVPSPASKSKPKAKIISDIVSRLNALLMELCGICGEYYHEDLNEKPITKCILCKQGCHNPCQEPIILRLAEFEQKQMECRPFMCTSCIGDHSEDDEDATIANAVKSKKSPEKLSQEPEKVSATPQSKSLSNQGDQDSEDKQRPPGSPKQVDVNVPVCPEYKWGRCPNYEECQFRHPPRCWKWLEKGQCSYNKKCRYHHPPLCYNSLWDRQCYNQDCKFFHLQKTKRFKMEEEQLKTSLNAGNYESQFPSLQHQDRSNHGNPSHEPLQMSHTNPQPQQNNHPRQNRGSPPLHPRPPNTPQQQNVQAYPRPNQHLPPSPDDPAVKQQAPIQNRLSKEDISFLALMIKEILKQEIGDIKENIKPSPLNPSNHQQNLKPAPQQVTPVIPTHPLLQLSPQIPNTSLYNLQVAPHPHASQ